jgi:hypothetical protein
LLLLLLLLNADCDQNSLIFELHNSAFLVPLYMAENCSILKSYVMSLGSWDSVV